MHIFLSILSLLLFLFHISLVVLDGKFSVDQEENKTSRNNISMFEHRRLYLLLVCFSIHTSVDFQGIGLTAVRLAS